MATTYSILKMQPLPALYAGALTIGKIGVNSLAIRVKMFYNGLDVPTIYTATSTADGTVTITIPTTARLVQGCYKFVVERADNFQCLNWVVTYNSATVNVCTVAIDVYRNCSNVDQAITLAPCQKVLVCS